MTTSRTHRSLRILAIAIAIAIPATLFGTLPASAADHFTVDNDGITLRNMSNDNPVFTGNLESWHDGTNIRGELSGSFTGRGTLSVTFSFPDGSIKTLSTYTAGVAQNVDLLSPAGHTIVRATAHYAPNSDSNCPAGAWFDTNTATCNSNYPNDTQPASRTRLVYVGDSPQSLGTCERLDDDDLSMQGTNSAAFFGHVTYGCTTGRIQAHVTGSLNWMSTTTGTVGDMEVKFFYSDGSSDFSFAPRQVTPGSKTVNIAVDSSPTKNVRTVQVFVFRDSTQAAFGQQRFGDA